MKTTKSKTVQSTQSALRQSSIHEFHKQPPQQHSKQHKEASSASESGTDSEADDAPVTFLTPRGYELMKDAMDIADLKETRKELTVSPAVPPTNPAPPKSFPIYRETKTRMIVPRHYGFENFGNPDVSTLSKGTTIHVPFHGSLRDYQHNIIDTYVNYVHDTKNHGGHEGGGGLISVGCGQGKTVMALNILSRLSKKTLVVVHKEFLLNQWIERIQQFLPTAKIGKIQGKIMDTEGKDIVLGMLQSISMKDYPLSVFSQFGLTIIDECHHIGAEVFCRSLFKMVTPYMLGLSATLKRKDGLSNVFKMFLGDVVYEMKRKVDHTLAEDDRVLIRAIQYDTDNERFSRVELNYRGQLNYSVMIRKLCESTHRTEFILQVIYDLLKENTHHQIMVLAHNKSILKYIYKAIHSREWCSVGYYLGGMKEKDLKESESKRVVIATYAMAEEALDIKTLTTLVMATPKTDVEQAVGRILRGRHEHARPIVVDMVDIHDVFKNQWRKRQTYYKKNGYEIVTTTRTQYERVRTQVYATNQPERLIRPPFHKHPSTEVQAIWKHPRAGKGTTFPASTKTTTTKKAQTQAQTKQNANKANKAQRIRSMMGVDVDALKGSSSPATPQEGFNDELSSERMKTSGCLLSVSTEELTIHRDAYALY